MSNNKKKEKELESIYEFTGLPELEYKLREVKIQIACLEETQASLENEIFYRKNPECKKRG